MSRAVRPAPEDRPVEVIAAPPASADTTAERVADGAIIDLYFARDERAITETQRRYGRMCRRLAEGILHSPPDAEECENDAYLRVWNSIPPQRPQSLRAYLCRIVRNLALNRLRDLSASRRDRDLWISLEEVSECLPAREEEPTLLARHLSDFLRTEEALDRKLFLGRYWYASSVKSLAEAHGLSPNAVSLRLYKTRARLRAYLHERGYSL